MIVEGDLRRQSSQKRPQPNGDQVEGHQQNLFEKKEHGFRMNGAGKSSHCAKKMVQNWKKLEQYRARTTLFELEKGKLS